MDDFGKVKTRKDGHDIYCKKCKSNIDRQHQLNLREQAFDAYGGPYCVNCGETFKEVLAIDHIHDDGSQDRKARGRGGTFIASLKREGWPEGFQILCLSCNFLKHAYPDKLDEFANRKQ